MDSSGSQYGVVLILECTARRIPFSHKAGKLGLRRRGFFIMPLSSGISCNSLVNRLNAELNPICHLLALLGGATIVVVSRLRVN